MDFSTTYKEKSPSETRSFEIVMFISTSSAVNPLGCFEGWGGERGLLFSAPEAVFYGEQCCHKVHGVNSL